MPISTQLTPLEKSFLPNSQGLANTYENKNTRFPILAANYTLEACQRLQQGEISTCAALYDFLAEKRAAMAKELRQGDVESFGVKRNEMMNLLTPVANQPDNSYADQYPALLSGLLKSTNGESKEINVQKEFGIYQEYNKFPFETLQTCHYYTISITIKMNGTPLTDIKIFQLSRKKLSEYLIYRHTIAKDFPALMARAEELFLQLLKWKKSENDEPAYYSLLGQLIWHLAQATPLQRGSAATTDMLCKTLLSLHQYPIKSYKKGIGYDLRAMSTFTAIEFAKTFYHLFEDTPDFSDPFQVNDSLIMAHRNVLPVEMTHWNEEYNSHQNLFSMSWVNTCDHKYYLDSFSSHQSGRLPPSAYRYQSIRSGIFDVGYASFQERMHNKTFLDMLEDKVSLLKWKAFQNNHISYAALKDIFLRESAGHRYFYQTKTHFQLSAFLEFINDKPLFELEEMTEKHKAYEKLLQEQDTLPLDKRSQPAWNIHLFFKNEKADQKNFIKNLIYKIYARYPTNEGWSYLAFLYDMQQCLFIINALKKIIANIESPGQTSIEIEDRKRIENAASLFPSLKDDFDKVLEAIKIKDSNLDYQLLTVK